MMTLQLLYNILIMTFVIVYIMDYSGILYDITKLIYKTLNPTKEYMGQPLPKPFSCSLCMSFWCVLVYLLVMGIPLLYSLGISCSIALISVLMNKLLRIIIHLINLI
jgi:hypothetical protein